MVRVESTDILHKHPTKMKHVSLFPHRCWTWRLATSMTLIHIAVFDASGQEAPSFANAQGSPGANYLQLRQAMEQWIASHPDEETEESELRAEFTRWDWFWSRRVGSGEGEPGALEPYREAIAAFTATPVCESGAINPSPWQELGPFGSLPNQSIATRNLGIVQCMDLDPDNPNDVFLGCRSSGIWHSSNALSTQPTWTCVTDMLHVPGLGVYDVEISKSDPDVVFAASGTGRGGNQFGCGVLRSLDHGATWEIVSPVEPDDYVSCRQLAIHPTDPNTVYAAVNTKVFKTVNGGNDWEEVLDIEAIEPTAGDNPSLGSGTPVRWPLHLLFNPVDPETVYMSTIDDSHAVNVLHNNDGSQVWVTHDGGATWSEIGPWLPGAGSECGGPIAIGVCAAPGQGDRLWVASCGDLWRSDDEGGTWSPVNMNLFGMNNMSISQTDENVQYYSKSDFIRRTTDGGLNHAGISDGETHIDCRYVSIFAGSPAGTQGAQDVIGMCTDGGAAVSLDGGSTWVHLEGSGLGIREPWGIAVNELSGSVGGGYQDNFLSAMDQDGWHQFGNLNQDGGLSASSRIASDLLFMEGWCCPVNDNIYACFKNGNVWSYQQLTNPINALPNLRVIMMDDEDRLYQGYVDIYRIQSLSGSPYIQLPWQKISDFPGNFGVGPTHWIKAMASAPSSPNIIYAAVDSRSWTPGVVQPMLFKTTIGGGQAPSDWTDISQLLPSSVTEYLSIISIAVDPEDPERLWIGCGGHERDWGLPAPYNGKSRVFQTEDGGQTWSDMSEGLPPLAVTDLVYQRGSDDGIYLATDVGVFYRDASMTQWECYNDGMSPTIVNDLEIDHCARKLYASVHGRGYWVTDLMETAHERLITSDLTIGGKQYLASSMRVAAGATLTITGTIKCYEGARIIVEPHARLVIDGGTITTQCPGTRWVGIEVHGTSTQNQAGGALATYQGKLEVKNGGTIENAYMGAVAGARIPGGDLDDWDWTKTGGIISASNSTFKNCQWGVLLLPWPDPSGGLSINSTNASRFTNCTFTVDSDYPDDATFWSHAGLWRVYGIRFQGCTFNNLRPDGDFTTLGSDGLGEGIYSYDSRFYVEPRCPCNQYLEPGHYCICLDRTTFEGLDHAIQASIGITPRGFSVTETDFVNNICGVMATGVPGPKVTKNHFTMGGRTVPLTSEDQETWGGLHRAVFTTESYSTRIDDNVIEMANGAPSPAEGIVVGFVRDHGDVVFRNDAIGLTNAYVAEGVNADPDNKTHVGLWWLCNDNVGNDQDFWNRYPGDLVPDDAPNATPRTIQGAPNRPADNTFNNTNAEGDFKNDHDQDNIVYWYRDDGQTAYEPEEVTPSAVAPQGTFDIPANNCSRRVLFTHIIGDHNDGTLVNGMVVLNEQKLAYGNTRYLYDQLIDGGSTDEVVNEIMHSWPEDAWELRAYMLAKSPFLSAEALKSLINKDVLPPAMLTEVLVANPEGMQSEGLFRWMQEESGYPLPAYLADLVMASWDQRTYRFALESELAAHHGTMTMAADLVLEEYQRDTVQEPVDSVRWLWQQVRTKAARYTEALTRLQQGDFSAAFTVVNNIPAEHDLRDPEELERQRMLAYINFLQGVYNTGRDETALTTAEVNQLEAIIAGQYDRPATWAQNLLCFGYGRCRPPLTGGAGSAKRFVPSSSTQASGPAESAAPLLRAEPNPANTYTTFRYRLPKWEGGGASIVVRDIMGKEQKRFPLSAAEGQLLWDTRDTAPGTYTVELVSASERQATERVVVKP